MKKKKTAATVFHVFITMIIFVTLDLISNIKVTMYLFEWTSRNHYLYLWIIAIIFIVFQKKFIGYSISIGNILGIVVGQFLGDYIIKLNTMKLNASSTSEEYYRFNYHYGVFIWIFIVIISFLFGVILQKKIHKK